MAELLIKQDAYGYWTAHTRTAIVARHLELDRVLWEARVYLSGTDTDITPAGTHAQRAA